MCGFIQQQSKLYICYDRIGSVAAAFRVALQTKGRESIVAMVCPKSL